MGSFGWTWVSMGEVRVGLGRHMGKPTPSIITVSLAWVSMGEAKVGLGQHMGKPTPSIIMVRPAFWSNMKSSSSIDP